MSEYTSHHAEQNRINHEGRHRAPEGELGRWAVDDTNIIRPLPDMPAWYRGQTVGVNALPLQRRHDLPYNSPRQWLDNTIPQPRVSVHELRHVPIHHTQDMPLELFDVGRKR